jgi:predicted naringenin-chalcone synthase
VGSKPGTDSVAEALEITPDTMLARFRRAAPELAEQAARVALDAAQLQPTQIDALLIATCTGYLCPGLTSYVSERLGLRGAATLLDLVGLGCGAAIPALRQAVALVRAGEAEHALIVCAEVCSAAAYFDDDPGVLISACLFGDGAAAVIVSREPRAEGRRVRWVATSSVTKPELRDKLRFEHRNGLLRNILAPEVPLLAAQAAREVFDQTMTSLGNTAPRTIDTWLWHAGGRDVIRALAEEFELDADDVRFTTEVLRRYGNMSSPSCLFALRDALAAGTPGGAWWLASFGAGFSSHGALLEVE